MSATIEDLDLKRHGRLLAEAVPKVAGSQQVRENISVEEYHGSLTFS